MAKPAPDQRACSLLGSSMESEHFSLPHGSICWDIDWSFESQLYPSLAAWSWQASVSTSVKWGQPLPTSQDTRLSPQGRLSISLPLCPQVRELIQRGRQRGWRCRAHEEQFLGLRRRQRRGIRLRDPWRSQRQGGPGRRAGGRAGGRAGTSAGCPGEVSRAGDTEWGRLLFPRLPTLHPDSSWSLSVS